MSLYQTINKHFTNLGHRFAAWLHPRLVPVSVSKLKFLYVINILLFFSCNVILIAAFLIHEAQFSHPAGISFPSHLTPNPSITIDYWKAMGKFHRYIDSIRHDSLHKMWPLDPEDSIMIEYIEKFH